MHSISPASGLPSQRGLAEASRLGGEYKRYALQLGPDDASMRARLYKIAKVLKDEADVSGGWTLEIEIASKDERKLGESGSAWLARKASFGQSSSHEENSNG